MAKELSKEIVRLSKDWQAEARGLVVNSKPKYELAAELASANKIIIKAIKDDFAESKAAAHSAWKAIVAQEMGHLEKHIALDRALKDKMEHFDRQERQKAAEKEAKLRAEQEAKAEELRKMGMEQEAKMVEQTPVKVENRVANTKNISYRDHYTFIILDESKVKRPYMTPDMKAIGQLVKANKELAEKMVGGIKVVKDRIASVSTR